MGPKLLTVDGIMGVFKKTIAKLETCEKNHETHAADCDMKAEALARAALKSKDEAARAKAVKAKLEDLLGG